MKELLKQIIFEQQDNCRHLMQDAIPRHIEEEWLTTSEILIITGVRRCGKSVLLKQLRDKLEEKDFFFMSFCGQGNLFKLAVSDDKVFSKRIS